MDLFSFPLMPSLVAAPTLAVWGADDGIVPRSHGDAYAAGIPGARLAVVDGCGHLPALEVPETLAAEIAAFAGAGAGAVR